jgi:hypothetical protein
MAELGRDGIGDGGNSKLEFVTAWLKAVRGRAVS